MDLLDPTDDRAPDNEDEEWIEFPFLKYTNALVINCSADVDEFDSVGVVPAGGGCSAFRADGNATPNFGSNVESDFGDESTTYREHIVLVDVPVIHPKKYFVYVEASSEDSLKNIIGNYEPLRKAKCQDIYIALLSIENEDEVRNFFSDVSKRMSNDSKVAVARPSETVHPVYLHLRVPGDSYDTVYNDLRIVYEAFRGPMFVHAIKSQQQRSEPVFDANALPRLALVFLFCENVPSGCQKMHKVLEDGNWQPISEQIHKLDNTKLYSHKQLPALNIGVRIVSQALYPGVQYVIYSNSQDFSTLCGFYSALVGNNTDSCTIGLNQYSELCIKKMSGAKLLPPNENISLSFRVTNDVLGSRAETLGPFGWKTVKDSDGNKVNLFVPKSFTSASK